MNEITVYELKNELDFKIIHESMSHIFQVKLIEIYEADSGKEVFKVPKSLLDGDGDFYGVVADLYGIALDSLMRLDFPEGRWDNFTQEEYDDYEEMLGNQPLSIEGWFLHDLKLTLDSYQLFYAEIETSFDLKNKQCIEEIIQLHNSPLQEIW